MMRFRAAIWLILGFGLATAQQGQIVWSEREKPIEAAIHTLRQVPDEARGAATTKLAIAIRELPASANKLPLAGELANLSTEGDFGLDTLREVAETLAAALRAIPAGGKGPDLDQSYLELAQLIRYEHVPVTDDSPPLRAALARLEQQDERRGKADFTLSDLHGKTWTLSQLRGKVVLVNFWATWCPPCRKEMPDLEQLRREFGPKGLVILAISDESRATVEPFIAQRKISYPILLDPGRRVNLLMEVQGIPKTFVYDRDGRLAAQAIDMRTRAQFLRMLEEAGLN